MNRYLLVLLFARLSLSPAHAQEQRILTSDSVALYVQVKGEGPACLFIHGGPGSGSHWLEKFFGARLEKRFRMIYVDQRGVGRSGSPADGNFSLERVVQDFEEVRQALGIERWLTLGHSFGGIVQAAYAEQHPEAVSGLLMINCTLDMRESFCQSWVPHASHVLGIDAPAECPEEPAELMAAMMERIQQLHAQGLMWRMGFAAPASEAAMQRTYGGIPDWNSDFAAVAFDLPDYWRDMRERTPHIAQPVLFFHGRTDHMVGPAHHAGIAFPRMMKWASDVGHMPFLEAPDDLERAIDTARAEFGW
jgi:proline iminopeptidase